MRTTRVLPSIAALLATVSLAACTTNSQVCNDGTCKISLSGKGATSALGGEGSDNIELVSADGKSAKLKIASQDITVTQGQTIDLNDGQITVTEVKEDKVKVEVTSGTPESSTTEDTSGDTGATEEAPADDTSGDAAQ